MPGEIILGLLLFFALIGFACYGFVVFLIKLFGKQDASDRDSEAIRSPGTRDLEDDVLGASHVLNYLYTTNKLDSTSYHNARRVLESEFADHFALSEQLESKENLKPPVKSQLPSSDNVVEASKVAQPTDKKAGQDLADQNLTGQDLVEANADKEIVLATKVVESTSGQSQTTSLAERKGPSTTAPWDVPDPPPREPRRTFKEMMAGFMLEKNIRWGELASGILIVGSAVGLVVSLRNELRDTIPYFSALLFLLITAAIHGAGIYTLKKWKLRNTSRGTLLIGLLLIPLNFLAACILSGDETERRSLTDPLLWTAIFVGLTSFGVMTWFSGKCLLRKGQLPLVVAIMGSAVGTLVINRTDGIDGSSIRKLWLSLPLAVSFLAGTIFIFKQQWVRVRWPKRTANRAFIFLGVSTFAFFIAASLLIIRASDKPAALVALIPSFAIVACITSWIGHIVWKGSIGRESKATAIAGLALFILGLVTAALAWIVSFSNPTVLLATSGILAVVFLVFAYQRRQPWLLPASWLACASFVLCAINLSIGKLPWDSWGSLAELRNAVLSGQTGISLLLVGIGVVGIHSALRRHVPDSKQFMTIGGLSGGLICSIGCLLALVASFVNPASQFDNMTATSLLGLASALALIGSYRFVLLAKPVDAETFPNPRTTLTAKWLVAIAGLILFGFFAHAFGWNRSLFSWLNETAFSINGNWPLIFMLHSTALSITTAVGYAIIKSTNNFQKPLAIDSIARFADISAVSGALALASSALLINHQTGLATMIVSVLAGGCLVLVWAQQDSEKSVLRIWSTAFSLLTAACVGIFILELLTRANWCPDTNQPRHWLIQIGALSIWFSIWMIVVWFLGRFDNLRKFVDFDNRLVASIGIGLAFSFVTLAGAGLWGESNVELFKGASTPPVSLVNDQIWVFTTVILLGIALLGAVFRHPVSILGAAAVVVWTIAWGLGSLYFADAKAVATVIRWLVPIGGAVGAAIVASRKPMIPMWVAARNQFGLSGRSTWSSNTTQTLINLSLVISSVVVLSISTVAIVQVMMFGGVDALGGPSKGTLFGNMKKDISYGIPVGVIVNTFLLYAISERRKWLATCGSAVFQYCVVLSVILLFISPHPKLASSWFVNILQAVSVGMTGYGFVWWYFRERIEGAKDVPAIASESTRLSNKVRQLDVHTIINGFLITSLAVLVIVRFFRFPQISGDWINSVGGPLGVGAWAFFGVLVYLVWQKQLRQSHRTSIWMWLSCWSGLVLVGMIAALFDRTIASGELYQPWLTFNLIMWGAIVVSLSQVILLFVARFSTAGVFRKRLEATTTSYGATSPNWSFRSDQTIPLLFAGLVAFTFAVRGAMLNPADAWIYVAAMFCLATMATIAGLLRQSGFLGFVSAGFTTAATVCLVQNDPNSWFIGNQPYLANVSAVALTVLAMIWSGYYVVQTVIRKQEVRSRVVWMSNVVMVLASVWLLLGAIVQWFIETSGANPTNSCLLNGWGIGLFFCTALLGYFHLWNDSRKGLVVSGGLWWLAAVVFITSVSITRDGLREAAMVLALGCAVACMGWFWLFRDYWMSQLTKLHAPKLAKFESSLYSQLPIFGVLVGLFVLAAAFLASFFADVRIERYLTAFSPFGLAIGFGCLSDTQRRRWVQVFSLSLLTGGAVLVAWADLFPNEIQIDASRLFVRALLVLAGAMFVYGGLVSRWVREKDRWLTSLREMSVGTCGLALTCLVIVVLMESQRFIPDVGCGMALSEAVAVAVAVIGMGIGLLVIAVRPKNDPFALSLNGRMGYVYVAQLVGALLVMHLYFTMPFLFQIGIKDYWPYIVMLMCFGGVGVAGLLEKRKLTVLGQPIFNTAAILPMAVAIFIWGIDSKADHSLVTLIVGLAYLMISYTHRSIVSGAAAILFGNLALWLFYGKFNGFSFMDHPQLWLIPPALSVLVAGQLSREKLSSSQLALIRYICVTTIYLSSTSEIFISGLGTKLWPPMVLAVLSVIGILAGMMFQVRAYLYLGAVFLLMAMVTMVSHAHLRLEHVWPWWAFGITMGVAILIMFGLFEKRKNNMKQVVGQLKQWEL